jgi:hypothetical protein
MIRKYVISTLAVLFLGFLIVVGYPAYLSLRVKGEYTEAVVKLRRINFGLDEYARRHGEYPHTLREVDRREYFGKVEIPRDALDDTAISYSRPDSVAVAGDFIMLSRPFSRGKVILRKDDSCEILKKDGEVALRDGDMF